MAISDIPTLWPFDLHFLSPRKEKSCGNLWKKGWTLHWFNGVMRLNFTIYRQTSAWLTKRGNKVFMGTQGLHAALVLIVPDTQGLVISTAHNKSPTRMEQHSTHPVIMTDLREKMKKEKLWMKAQNLLYDSVDLVNGKSHFSVFLKKWFADSWVNQTQSSNKVYTQGSYAVWKSMEKYGIWFE